MATVIKPSRSDEVVDPEEQLRITHEIKTRFESMAPKRPIKPNRSEPDPDAYLAYQTHSDPIPELQKLISFKSDHNQVICALLYTKLYYMIISINFFIIFNLILV